MLEYLRNFTTFQELFGSNPHEFLELVIESFAALDYLHSKGISHGDLGNPKNIGWDEDNHRVVLIDLENSSNSIQENINDNRDLALLLWIILDDDIPHYLYEQMVENDDYTGFVNYIKSRRENYDIKKQQAIDILLSKIS